MHLPSHPSVVRPPQTRWSSAAATARWLPVLAIAMFVVVATVFPANAWAQPGIDTPQTSMTPIGGAGGYPAPSTFSAPSQFGYAPGSGYVGGSTTPRLRTGTSGSLFDPYTGAPTSSYPTNVYPTTPSGSIGGAFVAPPSPSFGATSGTVFGGQQAPPLFNGGTVFGGSPTVVPSISQGAPTGFGTTIYPPSAIPSGNPSTLFPGGLFNGGTFGAGMFAGGTNTVFRLLQGPRLRHTFINAGNGKHDLEINDTDVSIAFAIPNFLSSNRPLFVVPSFSLHLWNGPQGFTGSDLPGNAYSGFLDFGWQTDPNQMAGLELGVRVGAFTDFDTFNSDSLRVMGKGLGSFRLTPYTTLKGGVYYLDRNKIKLLPAGGLLWQPNQYSRYDIFFPQPKVARYWRTVGTRDLWWYMSGDYGGGSWTIQRTNKTSDSIDINDIRVMLGFEWGLTDLIRVGRRSGFV
ncbi:MAG: hypothetical protein HKN47_12710, partial [Pirellulaceae bacterium]|nr:hypothetical protein [Pirellulaceae bacterium]